MEQPSRLVALAVLLLAAADARADAPAQPSSAGDVETSIASTRRRLRRETPGVVTVVTGDELLASGARDLADVLARVPGFQLGVDVANGLGAGFRGIWGQEGKILFMIDGIEMNDLSYGTFLLGRRLPAEQIERIEIIRGPGSALYGGHAELAVVNVVTRATGSFAPSVSLVGGMLARGAAGGALVAAGAAESGGVRAGVSASFASAVTSDRPYSDYAGTRIDLAESSRISPASVTARATWGVLDVRALYDDYAFSSRDGYDDVAPRDVDMRFRTAALDARASLAVAGGAFTVTPQLVYRWEQPWRARTPDLPDFYYDVTNERLVARLVGVRDTLEGPSLVLGAEGYVERGRVNEPDNGLLSYQGKSSVTYTNVAGFAELGLDTDWANLLAGARLEHHSEFGTSFVPRFAATRVFEPFHAKLLASGAFRAPSIENVNLAAERLEPERTWVFEGEVGWQPSDALYVAANVFDVTVLHPIVFAFDGSEAYANHDRTGSRGVEAEVHVRGGPVAASASYSFYTAAGKNRVPAYAVEGSRALLVGFAGHKVVASARIRALRRLVISPSVTFLSERAAFDGTESVDQPAARRIGARAMVDLFASWQDLGLRGLDVGVGVRDLLDEGDVYVQPYPGGHAPLPGAGREVWLRVRWEGAAR